MKTVKVVLKKHELESILKGKEIIWVVEDCASCEIVVCLDKDIKESIPLEDWFK